MTSLVGGNLKKKEHAKRFSIWDTTGLPSFEMPKNISKDVMDAKGWDILFQ
jgi:hypothetical protein